MKINNSESTRRESDYWGAFSRNLFVLSILLSFVSFWKWEFGLVAAVFMLGALYTVKVSEIAMKHEDDRCDCENSGACAHLNKNLEEMISSLDEK